MNKRKLSEKEIELLLDQDEIKPHLEILIPLLSLSKE